LREAESRHRPTALPRDRSGELAEHRGRITIEFNDDATSTRYAVIANLIWMIFTSFGLKFTVTADKRTQPPSSTGHGLDPSQSTPGWHDINLSFPTTSTRRSTESVEAAAKDAPSRSPDSESVSA
jgi:hypothetical protein